MSEQEWNEEQRALLTRTRPAESVLNVLRTLVRHTDLFKRWLPFGNQVLFHSTLPPREREIVILRIGHLCKSGYEFHHHVALGKREGLTDNDIQAIQQGADAAHWGAFDRLLLVAVDELHQDYFISDATWQGLTQRYSTNQIIDMVFAVGQYTMVSMALNSLGVQLEDTKTP
ncbi:MAG TPA: carboxymuconolactone decarboxylase family protein [Candidatus Saccharimonadales bacterium]|nr:carboxymuconolactone decarboxylase family protein [Candidatus Saccharimonadales bacterium]